MQQMWSACKVCGLQAGDFACMQKMWSACGRCLQAVGVVCMQEILYAGRICGLHAEDMDCIQEIGNLFTILLPKL